MFKNKKWGVVFLTIWLVNFYSSVSGQGFPDFFIQFLRYPENQAQFVKFPLKTDNNVTQNSRSYTPVPFLTRNSIPILCADSLNAIAGTYEPLVSIMQFNKETATNYLFEPRNNTWRLVSYQSQSSQNLADKEFINFLSQYSKDESFQMKHTIFPFPYRRFKSGKRDDNPENTLMMPREWEIMDFTAIFPALCIFNSNVLAPNRQIVVFRNGRMAQSFNFIRINRNWYLIEIEEYG